MKHIVPAVLAILLLAPTAAAQSRSFDLTGNFVWLDPTGSMREIANSVEMRSLKKIFAAMP